MPDTYVNPFGGMPNPAAFDISNTSVPSVMSARMAADNQLAAAPFIDLARQGQEQSLAAEAFKNQEYQSPWATAGRKGTADSAAAKGQVDSKSVDYKVEANRLANLMSEQQIQEAKDNHGKFVTAQNQGAFNDFADMGQQLSKLPPEARPMAFNQMKQSIQQKYPNADLPDYLKEYQPGVTDTALMQTYAGRLHSAANQAELDKQAAADAAAKERTTITANAGIKEAGIHEAGATARNERTLEEGNPQRQIMAQRKLLADPNASPQAKQQANQMLSGILVGEADKYLKDDPVMQAAGMQLMTAPDKTDPATGRLGRDDLINRLRQYKACVYLDHLKRNGVEPPYKYYRDAGQKPPYSRIKSDFPNMPDATLKQMLKDNYGWEY